MKKYKAMVGIIAVLVLGMSSFSFADTVFSGRVADLEGRIFFQSGRSLDWEEGYVNSPVLEGDRIWTDLDSLGEIQLNGGVFLRSGGDTKADILGLDERGVTVKLWLGSLYIRVFNDISRDRPVVLETPDGSVELLTKGLYRFDVVQENATLIRVYDGVAEMGSRTQTLTIRNGESYRLSGGQLTDSLSRFNSSERDNLGQYNDRRDELLFESSGSAYVDSSLDVGVYDLDYYGSWVDDASYGHCWRPRVTVGWVPYRFGRWMWIFPWGWTWISYEPWGWLPYHYGYWSYSSYHGWIWRPDHYFAPAWIVWTAHGDSVGWVPVHPDDVSHMHWEGHGHDAGHWLGEITNPRNATLHIGIQASTHIPRSTLEQEKLISTNSDIVRLSKSQVTTWGPAPPADIRPDRTVTTGVPSQKLQQKSQAKTWSDQTTRQAVTSEEWREVRTEKSTETRKTERSRESNSPSGKVPTYRTPYDSSAFTTSLRGDSNSSTKEERPREKESKSKGTTTIIKSPDRSLPTYRQPYEKVIVVPDSKSSNQQPSSNVRKSSEQSSRTGSSSSSTRSSTVQSPSPSRSSQSSSNSSRSTSTSSKSSSKSSSSSSKSTSSKSDSKSSSSKSSSSKSENSKRASRTR